MDYAQEAVENIEFQEMLKAFGICEPFDEQVSNRDLRLVFIYAFSFTYTNDKVVRVYYSTTHLSARYNLLQFPLLIPQV